MRLTLVQMEVTYKKPQANLDTVESLLTSCQTPGHIVLLPELFTSGYLFKNATELHDLARETAGSKTIAKLQSLACQFDTLIVAGLPEKKGNQYFNTAVAVDKNGLKACYRKISQTNIDRQYFSRGNKPVVFEHMGIRFGIAICFDLWFPEIMREYVKMGVDVILHPANFGGQQSLHMARARAIENDVYIATCNRLGSESTETISGHYCGHSQICTPTGDYLLKLEHQEETATATLNIDSKNPKKVIGVNLIDEMNAITKILKTNNKES
ncbi:carbon-nitrogen hydrolase family protein [Endozoicomonas elysicola]|uniref:Carbon-nitrogen hydrolase n=1 Tax=Endozoicomonas elysicola TaxID=305900 RepID=A0A081KG27_9GAMM|nr:carbon-nitrogen hydrolase family protein [Endozoicomonas elysicola]KEI73103.1 carbon-nitrogen hydrolase [Endozoicomonas elysicola]